MERELCKYIYYLHNINKYIYYYVLMGFLSTNSTKLSKNSARTGWVCFNHIFPPFILKKNPSLLQNLFLWNIVFNENNILTSSNSYFLTLASWNFKLSSRNHGLVYHYIQSKSLYSKCHFTPENTKEKKSKSTWIWKGSMCLMEIIFKYNTRCMFTSCSVTSYLNLKLLHALLSQKDLIFSDGQ